MSASLAATRLSPRLIGAIAAAVATIAAWCALSSAISQSTASTNPERALWWMGDQAEALTTLAARDIVSSAPDAIADATARATAALRAEPLSPRALDVLATAAESHGRQAVADRLARMAATLSARDLVAQTWIFTRDLETGRATSAMAALDAMIRAHPEIVEGLATNMAPLLEDPIIAAALAAELSRDPPWRSLLIGVLVRQNRDPRGILRLFARLQDLPGGLTRSEFRSFLAGLIASGRYEQAYLAWLSDLPRDRLSALGFLYNGKFQYPVTDTPFDWTFTPTPGTEIEIGEGDKGRSLDVGFLGGDVDFKNVTHDLMLNPGHYVFEGLVRADHLENERGLRWRVACVEHPDDSIGTSDLVSGDMPWRPFSAAFEVPETDCRAQILRLELPARTARERIASGVVSYADLAVEER